MRSAEQSHASRRCAAAPGIHEWNPDGQPLKAGAPRGQRAGTGRNACVRNEKSGKRRTAGRTDRNDGFDEPRSAGRIDDVDGRCQQGGRRESGLEDAHRPQPVTDLAMQRVRMGVVGVDVRGKGRSGRAKLARQVIHVGVKRRWQRRGAHQQRYQHPGKTPADKAKPGKHLNLQSSGAGGCGQAGRPAGRRMVR